MNDPRHQLRDELIELVDVVARKPNGVRALGILIQQAEVLARYKSNRKGIGARG